MNLIVCHNRYQQLGGEDLVFEDETALLEAHGHRVLRFEVSNDSVRGRSKLALARDTIWNRNAARELGQLVRRERVDVVHFHNTFPLISPAAYYATRDAGAAVVQTLHNFRLTCPGASLLRDGKPCESCLGKRIPWPSVVHGCYRQCRATTAVVASMLSIHRVIGTWSRAVDAYIALTHFARQKLIEGGLPSHKVIVKPNFVESDPGLGTGAGGYAAFVGRLSTEKGIDVLLDAWSRLAGPTRLVIVGDGPLSSRVQQAAAGDQRIELVGRQAREEVFRIIGQAACVIVPSICYEGFPRTLAESFAKGTPIIASRLGAMAELVDDAQSGLHFQPGDAGDLAKQVEKLMSFPQDTMGSFRQAARHEYERLYSAEANYKQLMAVYEKALAVSIKPCQSIKNDRRCPPVIEHAGHVS